MKVKDLLLEYSLGDRREILNDFLKYCADILELSELPEIQLVTDKSYSAKYKSFGGYQPGENKIILAIEGRHIADILRTLAHELTHYKQDLNGDLEDPNAGETGSDQENEANSVAGVLMRDFGRSNPKIYE